MVIMATPQYQTQAHLLKNKTDIRFITMLRGIVTFFLALAWFVSPAVEAVGSPQATDSAKTSVRTANAPAAKHAKGLLWKIEKAGLKPSYLFGTIHSDDPRVTALPDAVATAFDNSHSFTMEALIDSSASILEMAEAMFFSDARTLAGVLGKELYAQTLQAMNQHGLPVEGIE
ncbi:MAG: TraB/GumN family protein, partial [Pseudomonadota bacterium]